MMSSAERMPQVFQYNGTFSMNKNIKLNVFLGNVVQKAPKGSNTLRVASAFLGEGMTQISISMIVLFAQGYDFSSQRPDEANSVAGVPGTKPLFCRSNILIYGCVLSVHCHKQSHCFSENEFASDRLCVCCTVPSRFIISV
jgi:hypothetical protein